MKDPESHTELLATELIEKIREEKVEGNWKGYVRKRRQMGMKIMSLRNKRRGNSRIKKDSLDQGQRDKRKEPLPTL